jgi:hypothetical protein
MRILIMLRSAWQAFIYLLCDKYGEMPVPEMFKSFPDIVSIEQIMEMLHIGKSTAYALLRSNQIRHVRIVKKYIVPKRAIIGFLENSCYNKDQIINDRLNQQSSKGELP